MLIGAGLLRKKMRTVLTILSIVVAFVLFGLLQGINQDIKRASAAAPTTGSGRRTSVGIELHADQSDGSDCGVRGCVDRSCEPFGGYFQDSRNALPVSRRNVEQLAASIPELNIGGAQIDAMESTRAGVLIGRALANKYGWKLGDKIPVGTTLWIDQEAPH